MLRRFVPFAADTVARLGMLVSGLLVACGFLAAALIWYYVTRPLLSEEAEPSLLAENR